MNNLILTLLMLFFVTSQNLNAHESITPLKWCDSKEQGIVNLVNTVVEQARGKPCIEAFETTKNRTKLLIMSWQEDDETEPVTYDLRPLLYFKNLKSVSFKGDRQLNILNAGVLGEISTLESIAIPFKNLLQFKASLITEITGLRTLELYFDNNIPVNFALLHDQINNLSSLEKLSFSGLISEAMLYQLVEYLKNQDKIRKVGFQYIEIVQSANSNPRSLNDKDLAVIASYPQIRELEIEGSDLTSLSSLRKLAYLEKLRYSGQWESIVDLEGLASLKNLKCLQITSAATHIQEIGFLTNLEELAISSSSIDNLSFLKNLKELQILSLSEVKTADYSALAGLTKLTKLDLSGGLVEESRILKNLTLLEELDLNSNPKLVSLTGLSKLTQLKKLNLGWTAIKDDQLIYLKSLTKLEDLALNNTPLNGSGLDFLKDLINVHTLDLDECHLDDQGLENFKYWPKESKLNHLRLFKNYSGNLRGRTFSALSHFENLETLYISFNQIDDEGLAVLTDNLKSVRILGLRGNEYTDMGVALLSKMDSLKDLSLAYNKNITAKAVPFLQQLKQLTKLNLGRTMIKETDPEVIELKRLLHQLEISFISF